MIKTRFDNISLGDGQMKFISKSWNKNYLFSVIFYQSYTNFSIRKEGLAR
jgi:hypothetical protein